MNSPPVEKEREGWVMQKKEEKKRIIVEGGQNKNHNNDPGLYLRKRIAENSPSRGGGRKWCNRCQYKGKREGKDRISGRRKEAIQKAGGKMYPPRFYGGPWMCVWSF